MRQMAETIERREPCKKNVILGGINDDKRTGKTESYFNRNFRTDR